MAECVIGDHIDPRSGYARTCAGHARWALTHRLLWIEENGPIPKGMHLHHACENTACINIEHLELLTPLEHKRRHWNCDHGSRYVDAQGHWRCHECDRIRNRRYERRKHAKLVAESL